MGDPKKIQESEDLSLLLENAFVSVHLVGKDGTILWANNAELVSLGYTFDEFVDHSITEFHADQKVISDILHKLSDGDTLIDYPAQLVCKNGQIRDVLINSNVYWVDGEFVHTRCFTRDITERKRAEAKLLESNQRLGKTLEELQASTEEIALVDGVAQIITSTLDIDEVYEKFAEAMNKLVAFNKATINTVDWESRTYTLKYHFGPEQPNRPLGTVTPLGGSQAAHVIASGKTIMREDLSRESQFPSDEIHKSMGLLSNIAVPLISKGRVIGAMSLRSERAGEYGPRERAILERLANQIAPAIENSQIYLRLQANMGEMDLVDEVARIITSTLNIDEVYEQFALELKKLVDFDRISVNIIEQGAQNYLHKYLWGPGQLDRSQGDIMPLEGSWTQQVMTTKQTLIREDYLKFNMRSGIAVPLIFKGVGFGSLFLRSRQVGRYGRKEQVILERLAHLIAPAIENARSYQETRQAEEALRESEERYRSLYNNTPIMLHSIDRDTRLVRVNNYWLETLGYEWDEVIGHKVAGFLTEASRHYAEEVTIPYLFKTGAIRDVEYQMVKKNGEVLDVLLSAVAEVDEAGEIDSLAFIVDITERKAAEELQLANINLTKANEAKTAFLTTMSHELRTPLNSIIGFSEILQDQTFGEVNQHQARYINNVLVNGRHLLVLINEILEVSTIEAGGMELVLSQFEVREALAEALEAVRLSSAGKEIEMTSEVESELPAIYADESKFKQVVYNLVGNAIKFTPKGGRINVVAFSAQDGLAGPNQAIPEIRISISDTGIGIKPEDQERIFEAFVQVDSSSTREQVGAGLGLTLTRRLVELHGGRIWVDSEGIEGKVTTFTFVLPVTTGRRAK